MAQIQKWWNVFVGNEEQRFFVGKDFISGLVRNKKYVWRSLKGLAEESGLTEKRTEEILSKYIKAGVIIVNEGGDKYAYWERVDNEEIPGEIEKDQKERISKASQK